ncbi:MAG: HAD-IIB family hydrolase [Chloroflexota bacterium]
MARARVLISDLDGTLVGDDAALERFALWRATEGRGWCLVYATGRSRASVRGLLDGTDLPQPDALITEVGTVISEPGSGPWHDWPPPLERWDAVVVRRVLGREPGLEPQSDDAQSDVKASYRTGALDHRDLLRIVRALRVHGVAGRLVHSAGRYLDVLPRTLGKRAAAQHLLMRWGMETRDAVTAGNSGNDRDLLRLGGHGVVVGNACQELRTLRGPRIVHARAAHADGVLEGLRVIEPAAAARMPHHADASPAGGRPS